MNKVNIILDTDIENSWDDQFALAYLLKNENLFNIDAITIEPFKHTEGESVQAINMNPSIINKIEIIWLGGNSLEYGNNKEFNFMQDIDATIKVINSKVNMTIIPARNVAIDLMINISELERKLNMNNELSKYLCNRFLNDEFYGIKQDRILWDISVIAYLINKKWFNAKEIKGLRLSEKLQYYTDTSKTSKIMVEQLDSKKIYEDLFKKLNK